MARVALVTGGTRGIGAAISKALKAAGYKVAASYAGNDAAADPGWPARYAVDSRFAGSVMAVGATDQSGALASFSDQAGVAANGYIAAPGPAKWPWCRADGGPSSTNSGPNRSRHSMRCWRN